MVKKATTDHSDEKVIAMLRLRVTAADAVCRELARRLEMTDEELEALTAKSIRAAARKARGKGRADAHDRCCTTR